MKTRKKQQSWKINVHSRARKFHFNLKATTLEPPTWMLYFLRFSLFIRLHDFLLQVKSESGASVSKQKPKPLKSKFLKVAEKLKTGLVKKKEPPNLQQPPVKLAPDLPRSGMLSYKDPICVGSILGGTVVLLWESICKKDEKRMTVLVHCSSVLLIVLGLLLKKCITGNSRTLTVVVFLVIETVICAVVLHPDKCMKYGEVVGKVWNYVASSLLGCLCPFFPGHVFKALPVCGVDK